MISNFEAKTRENCIRPAEQGNRVAIDAGRTFEGIMTEIVFPGDSCAGE
jgi:hypothetical protein